MTNSRVDFDRDTEDARSVCRDLQAVFGEGDDFSQLELEEVKRLCLIAHLIIHDTYCQHVLCEIERYSEQLVSGDLHIGTQSIYDLSCEVRMRELIRTLIKVVDQRLGTEALHRRARSARLRASTARRVAREMNLRLSCARLATIPSGLLPPAARRS